MADVALDAKARRIFAEVYDLSAPEREARLVEAAAGDVALAERVRALLAAAELEDGFLSDPTMGMVGPGESTAGATGGARGDGAGGAGGAGGGWDGEIEWGALGGRDVGPYRILGLIGEGGFGSVYMAEQTAPVRRRVALKVIKLGMDTKAVVARFEQERQALALMDHPHIAKVLDAGATRTGRPYFVMELVRGEPITRYCDGVRMPVRERLELFTQVCRGVQHAHAKGVIHRDLKPSNVLVSVRDDRPEAKIIDFGIAKATQGTLTGGTVFTEARQLVGTPEYMSPEQAQGSHDIDTRTDVYSLGVLLYELLTGTPPVDPQRLRSASSAELERLIREVDPPPPSTRLSQVAGEAEEVAARRRCDLRRLRTLLKGELDWIVMRAIEKDRTRRYDSVGALARDIERHLGGQVIEAAPPGAGYRARKFIRRHRVGMSAAAMVVVALVAGLAAALWQAGVAARERDAAIAARNEADLHRRQTEQVAEFQAAQLTGIDVEQMGRRLREAFLGEARASMEREGRGVEEIEARQQELSALLGGVNATNVAMRTLDENIIGRAIEAAGERFEDQPLVKADLLHTLGGTALELGLLERVEPVVEESLAIRRRLLGDGHVSTLQSLNLKGNLLMHLGRFGEAEAIFREADGQAKLNPSMEPAIALASQANLALALHLQDRLSEAREIYERLAKDVEKALGPEHPDTLQSLNNYAGLLTEEGRLAEAEATFADVVRRRRRTMGDDELGTLNAINNLAIVVDRRDRYAEAEGLYREAYEGARRTLGEDHPHSLLYASNLGFVLYEQARFEEAERYTRRTFEVRQKAYGDEHPDTLQSMHNLGILMHAMGRLDEADAALSRARDLRAAMMGPDHFFACQSLASLAALRRDQGRPEEAETLHREAMERAEQRPPGHPQRLEAMLNMGQLRLVQGRAEEAEPLLRQAAEGYAKLNGPRSFTAAVARAHLGRALAAAGRYAEAERELLAADEVLGATGALLPERRRVCPAGLVELYEAWERAEPGRGHGEKASPWREKLVAVRGGMEGAER